MSDTPETSEAWDAVSRTPDGMYSTTTPMKDYAYAMLEQSKKLERERNELLEWKRQAMAVMPDYQEIGRLLDLPLGTPVYEHIIPAIRQRNELLKCLIHLKERDWFKENTDGPVICKLDAAQVRAAIAKAEGRES